MNKNDEPIEPAKMTRQLIGMETDEQRDLHINAQISKVPDDYADIPEVQSFTDINRLFDSDYHSLIQGRTGAGKTTLRLTLLKKFLDYQGDTVILDRDDGGLEFQYLACYVPTRVFIPEDNNISLDLIGFQADIVPFKHPREIVEQVWRYDYPYNVIVYDVFCDTSAQRAKFYSELFMTLINTLQRMRKSAKRKVVFSIDELNDLIPPRGKGSPEFNVTRADVEMNIRKIRKHGVQMIASSHRFNQIGLDTRSQFEQIYIKKSYGYDVWDFLSKNLVTSNTKTFWRMIKLLLTLPRSQFVLFDENRNFDLYEFPDIPRPKNIDIEALGSIPIKTKEEKAESIYRDRYLGWVKFCAANPIYIKDAAGMRRVNVKMIADADKITTQNLYGAVQKHEAKVVLPKIEEIKA